MKAKECTLKVYDSWGQIYPLIRCKSISEAKRKGWESSRGFCFMVLVGKKMVYRGYCKNY